MIGRMLMRLSELEQFPLAFTLKGIGYMVKNTELWDLGLWSHRGIGKYGELVTELSSGR